MTEHLHIDDMEGKNKVDYIYIYIYYIHQKHLDAALLPVDITIVYQILISYQGSTIYLWK